MSKHISKAKKKKIVNKYYKGAKIPDLSKQYRIPISTIYTWIKKYPPAHLKHKFLAQATDYRNLEKRATKFGNELNLLQSFLEYKGIENKERYEFMDLLYGKFTIHELCGAFNIDRGTYYNHLRSKDKYTHFKDRNARIDPIIYKIHNDFREYGAERIAIAIREETGEAVSPDYIRKRMRYLGIESSLTKKPKPRFLRWNTRKQTLLVKKYEVTDINQVWVADITECQIKGIKRYISIYEDLCSRKIIAYNVGYNQTTQLVRLGLDHAMKTRHPKPGLFIVHTDGGAQYNSWTMRRLYAKYKINHSVSRPAMPADNANVESFNRTLKSDFIKGGDQFHSDFEFREKLDEFIEKYNSTRVHTALGTSPDKFEEKFKNRSKKS